MERPDTKIAIEAHATSDRAVHAGGTYRMLEQVAEMVISTAKLVLDYVDARLEEERGADQVDEQPHIRTIERELIYRAVDAEIERAQALHGKNFMGNLERITPMQSDVLEDIIATGRQAKFDIEEMGDVCRTNVLVEEIGEAAEDLLNMRDPRAEFVQVVAMVVAWVESQEVKGSGSDDEGA